MPPKSKTGRCHLQDGPPRPETETGFQNSNNEKVARFLQISDAE
jgi:hypothetical protein